MHGKLPVASAFHSAQKGIAIGLAVRKKPIIDSFRRVETAPNTLRGPDLPGWVSLGRMVAALTESRSRVLLTRLCVAVAAEKDVCF